MSQRKDLFQQAHEILVSMQAFGRSKVEARKTGEDRYLIFSFSTYQTYRRHIMYFLDWVRANYPKCRTVRKARRYVNKWLKFREDQGLSAWTIAVEQSALCKLYHILPDDPNRYVPPKRHRKDIKRSRKPVASDKFFSLENNDELIKFITATGTRRSALERLRGDDLWSRDRMQNKVRELSACSVLSDKDRKLLYVLNEALSVFPEYKNFVYHHRDKGGRSRFAPIISEHEQLVVERMQNTAPDELVWKEVHKTADIHSYRAEYAAIIYRRYARPIEEIPYDRINRGSGRMYQSDVYVCRNDEKGKKLDKAAMRRCSKALGHNRLQVVANNYLWRL